MSFIFTVWYYTETLLYLSETRFFLFAPEVSSLRHVFYSQILVTCIIFRYVNFDMIVDMAIGKYNAGSLCGYYIVLSLYLLIQYSV